MTQFDQMYREFEAANPGAVLQRVRITRILEELDARRGAGEPWPPSAERVGRVIADMEAEGRREFGAA